ncbi:ABC transporter ATP-binding protein [Phaeobacter sp.]|uniref:ABC transporter ATP-binding protein n=1 Tax=Phaeobacter sp. TaxID=1902409 RepID=UPI0025CFF65E|nr:ABC transporter ATP-binding protein [Phaeobacter sp.]
MDHPARLKAQDISLAFAKNTPVLRDLSVDIPDGKITVIIGPNACGKSTLLRSLARLQPTDTGEIKLDGTSIRRQNSRAVARQLAILPQNPTAPEGLSVRDLVSRGRTPYQSALRQYGHDDASKIDEALAMTGMSHNAHRPIDALSGGQRQRAWIAMTLAQDTEILLLDEPTTFLDLPHQMELLKLVQQLNTDTGRTVAMVLHDINLAARFAHHIIALKDGRVLVEGTPDEVITTATMAEIFDLSCTIIADPVSGTPHVIPT